MKTQIELNVPVIRLLIAKDWKLFEKQLAAYVAAGIVALVLLGMAKKWTFYLGSLMLIVVLVAAACFAISSSLINERKQQTLAFVMSLPVSPLDFFLAKLLGNLATFGVPYLFLTLGTVAVILTTPIPDGLLVLSLLVLGHILLAYCISLSIAMAVESEGWNVFTMIGSMVLINPLIAAVNQMPSVANSLQGDIVVWSAWTVAILFAQVTLSLAVLVVTGWVHCRKKAFY
ncbi:MAG: ABC-2 transporter permease [Casimicrobium sp.]